MQSSISTRSISNVTVSFGTFASFESKIYAAAREEGSGLNLVAKNTAGVFVKPSQQYAIDGKVIPWNDLERGYEMGDDTFVMIPKPEIEACKAPGSKQVEITKFIPLSQVDPLYFDKSYVLAPNVDKKDKSANPKSVTSYALLLAVLTKIGKVGQAKLELRGKEHNVIIRAGGANGDVLMLHTLFNTSEIRNVSVQRPTFDVATNEELVNVGTLLVNQLSANFDAKALTSTSDEKLSAVIDRMVAESLGVTAANSTAPPVNEADTLLAALAASLHATGTKVVKDEKVTA